MSVEAINSVQNNITTGKPLETPKAQPVEEKKNGTALLLGSLAALAIGGGIYLATRGKKGTSEAGSSTEKPLEQIKEMAIDAFKQAGNRFERGKALSADGTGYTGFLTHTADGKKLIMQYKDGVLQKAEKYDTQTNKKIYSKTYIYCSSNGRLSTVKDEHKELFQIFGSGIRTSDGYCGYNFDKSIITVRKNSNQTEKGYEYINGKRILRTECKADDPSTLIFYRDDGTKEFALRDCSTIGDSCNSGTRWNGTIEVYDNNGKLTKTLERLDNPKEYYALRNKYLQWHKNMG